MRERGRPVGSKMQKKYEHNNDAIRLKSLLKDIKSNGYMYVSRQVSRDLKRVDKNILIKYDIESGLHIATYKEAYLK